MKFILVLAIILFQIFLIHFFEVVEIIGAFGIDTLMYDKVFAVFLWDQSIATVRAAQFHRGESTLIRGESRITDLTEELTFGTVIFVQKKVRGITAGAGAGVRNITFRPTADRADFFTVTFFVVRDEIFISPVLAEVSDQREFINLELLVFWGMGIIKSPLLQGNVSADKVKKPTDLFMLVLNKLK